MRRVALVALVMSSVSMPAHAEVPRDKVAVARAGARASLSADGAWLSKGTAARKRLSIVEERGKRPRFVEYVAGLKLVMYVDRAALATCVLPGTEIGGAVLDRAKCVDEPVKPGAPIKLRWTWDGGAIELKGKVLAAKLATFVTEDAAEPLDEDADVTLPASYKVLGEPGGKPVMSGSGPIQRATKLAHKGGHTLVRTQLGVVGWVDTRELGVAGSGAMGVEGGALGSSGLAVGTKLYDAVDGREIGEVEWRFDATPVEHRDGWSRFDVRTDFGVVPVWARGAKASKILKVEKVEKPTSADDLMNLDPGKLRAHQLTGSIYIEPDAATKAEIAAAKKSVVVASLKLCVDTKGRVSDVTITKSSGFSKYDADISAAVRAWTFRPYLVDGKAAKVCAPASVVYRATR
jgi:TonB family protein